MSLLRFILQPLIGLPLVICISHFLTLENMLLKTNCKNKFLCTSQEAFKIYPNIDFRFAVCLAGLLNATAILPLWVNCAKPHGVCVHVRTIQYYWTPACHQAATRTKSLSLSYCLSVVRPTAWSVHRSHNSHVDWEVDTILQGENIRLKSCHLSVFTCVDQAAGDCDMVTSSSL